MKDLEKLLIVATILMPFTLLRFGAIGFGEVIIIILFLYSFSNLNFITTSVDYIFTKLWTLLIVVSLIGFSYHALIVGYNKNLFSSMVFDLLSYIAIFLTCILFEKLIAEKKIDSYRLFRGLFFYGGAIFSLLYIVSLFTPSIFGLSLRYFNWFSPLSSNLHQTSMFMAPLPFFGLFIWKNESNKLNKLIISVYIVLFCFMVIESGSFKAYLGLILGFLIYISLRLIYVLKGQQRLAFLIMLFGSGLFFLLLNYNSVLFYSEALFKEEDLNDGRAILYSNALHTVLKSPLIGLGPGSQLNEAGNFRDAHQTLLTIFLQMGLVGMLVFLTFMRKIYKVVLKSPALFSAVVPITIYALGGDILRRIPIWIVLMIIYYSASKISSLPIVGRK